MDGGPQIKGGAEGEVVRQVVLPGAADGAMADFEDKEKNDGRCGRRQSSMRSYDGTASSTAKWGPLGAWSDTEMADHTRGVLAFRLFMGQLAVAWSVVG